MKTIRDDLRRRPGGGNGPALLFAGPLLAAALCSACGSGETQHPEWRAHFEAVGVEGCLTVYDQVADRFHRYNPERCARGFLPASTFKIFNSLVALETGVAPDADFALPWDGEVRTIPEWNRDQTMRSAIQVSAVWYYRELARRIGPERMRNYLREAAYGNGDLSAGIDQFWLTGGFRVTPEGQIDFLRRLRAGTLPFSSRSQSIVQSILIEESQADYTLSGKTGLATDDAGPRVGWWIGYLQQNENTYFFALNIAGGPRDELMDFARKRKIITRAILKERLGLL